MVSLNIVIIEPRHPTEREHIDSLTDEELEDEINYLDRKEAEELKNV